MQVKQTHSECSHNGDEYLNVQDETSSMAMESNSYIFSDYSNIALSETDIQLLSCPVSSHRGHILMLEH